MVTRVGWLQAVVDFLVGLFLGRLIDRAMMRAMGALDRAVHDTDIDTVLADAEGVAKKYIP